MSRVFEPGGQSFCDAVNDQIEKEYGLRAFADGPYTYDERMMEVFFRHPKATFTQSSIVSRQFVQNSPDLAAKIIGHNIVNAFRNYDSENARVELH